MTALTPAEKETALAVYREWVQPSEWEKNPIQTNPFWKTTTPLQVVTAAFNSIFDQLDDPLARADYRKHLNEQAKDVYNEYDFPSDGGQFLRVPGSRDLIKLGTSYTDQYKLDRAIYEILRVGLASGPPKGGRRRKSKRRSRKTRRRYT